MKHNLATVLACVMTVAVASPARAADGDEQDLRVRVLVASLSGYSESTRDAAQSGLLSLGGAAQSRLETAAATGVDEDARRRAQSVLDEIRITARLRELMEPTRVTLHFDQTPARRVLASLYVRAGSQWRLAPPEPFESAGDQPVTVHLDNVPFWDALARVEELSGLTLTDGGDAARFVKLPMPLTKRPRTSVHGPFRVVAEDGPLIGSVAALKVYAEPKIQVAWHARQARLTTDAAGGGGVAKAPPGLAWLGDREADARIAVSRADVFDVELPLAGLFRPARVSGTIPVLLIAREDVIEGLDAASGTTSVAGEATSWILRPYPGEIYTLELQPRLGWPNAAAPFAAKVPSPMALSLIRPALCDAQGVPLLRQPTAKPLWRTGYLWTFHQPAAGKATTRPGLDRRPTRLTLSVPTVSREIEIPFDFAPPAR